MPRPILESYFSGKAFDYNYYYTPLESEHLRADINDLYRGIVKTNPVKELIAIVTAGAPGCGKTIKLRQDRDEQALHGKNYAYVDTG